ncbi:hypothetical protein Dimus_034280 [Dionaea muscipula]
MATAIIRSQDCLGGRLATSRQTRFRRRKTNTADKPRRLNEYNRWLSSSSPRVVVEKFQSKDLVMGQVKILKRGEDLKPATTIKTLTKKIDANGALLSSTDLSGPDPEVVQKHVRTSDLYAGSASFCTSPPPSSLPFPAALVRSGVATSDLRRMLKI